MKRRPIFLIPVFQERIWGGTKLRDQFDYDIPNDLTGECWAISGHKNGQCIVRDGEWRGQTLGELWENNRELFDHLKGDRMPLLTKILDANKDLSVQVHPNDSFAQENENGELGKTECWYIIDCKEDAEIIYGHLANSKEELVEWIEKGKWNNLLRRQKIKPGDFFYVPSGTIHALCEGTLVLETQQSSDTTYRVYDYDRKDKNGNRRELHLEKAIEVTIIPHEDYQITPTIEIMKGLSVTRFVEDTYFSVYKWCVDGKAHLSQNQPFELVSVINGFGSIEKASEIYEIKRGDHFILPSEFGEFTISGQVECIVSHPH